MVDLLKSGRVIFGEDESQIIQIKEYLRDYEGSLKSVIELDSRVGANTLEAIFGSREAFKGPKPVDLIKMFVRFCTRDGDVVLDSFAGSGTTGHAVLEANREDGETRAFVLIQMPFDSKRDETTNRNICEQITAERIRRVIQGYGRVRRNRRGSTSRERVGGLGGEFTYARLGPRLLDEFRGFAEKPPAYEDLAKYVWFTDTSQPFNAAKMNRETGRIGVHERTAYYLLYAPEGKGRTALDREFLDGIKKDKSAKKVVYCEKVWVHRDELAAHGVLALVVPFHLK